VSREDWNSVIRIGKRCFNYIENPGQFFLERMIRYYFFVGELDGEVVGFVDMEKESETVAQITGLAVAPEFRGRGIGSALLDFGLRFLKSLGFRKARVMTLRTNTVAMHMYKKHGFVETENNGDVVFLEKEL
jgi:ribosomal-protein-alanine N-acetyltransferase